MKSVSQAVIVHPTSGFKELTIEQNTSEGIADDTNDAIVTQQSSRSWLNRVIFALLGVFFVVIAAVGVFLPGIPTVGPLLLASVFLTKASPELESRLIRNKFFARYLHYLDGTTELSPRAKLTSIVMMWLSITVSYIALSFANSKPWLLAILVLAGVIGTIFIIRFGRKQKT